ncbi:hypothetical protein TRFO_04324 [Tritrichomonas foetus]|uniref:Uncharacterized protein n=1 Tax=Tritrichomonas foetus TaxID=1144522 RepID=A0A1J4KH51_9EUKA|nr:hypothetical protein TRFO_04324 [Tritrichomonas foetus]|eukprot:OHT10288.1 hypothetical protein TRFO_04324 [Tritrichomonas foetus]
MAENEQADVLIVGDQPYSSDSSSESDENDKKKEEEEYIPKNDDAPIEESPQPEIKPKPKKPAEPIFVPVISGTATVDDTPADPNKINLDKDGEISNDDDEGEEKGESKNANQSKCCLLL